MTSRERSYAVVGAGAVGGLYGGQLQRAGFPVHFLFHQDYAHVVNHGLRIDSWQGDFYLPQVQAYPQVSQMPACDVVIVAIKTLQNHLLTELLPPLLKPDGIVLLLQNGLGGEEWVAKIIGPKRVIAGLCFVSSNKIGPGHIHHLDYGSVHLAEYGDNYQVKGITQGMLAIQSDFQESGIPVQLGEDWVLSRWQKLVWNIPFNGLSVIFNATTDQMMSSEDARYLIKKLMQEVVVGAAAWGRTIADEFLQEMIEKTEKMKPYRTSMKIDYEQRRPLEIEAIIGHPWRSAQSQGVDLTHIQMLYHQLKFLDQFNRDCLI
ncbi:MAG: putative 2-dehydropantoate 2-reductase [Cyanobacteriota bacterium]|nr:putative 2-dehydropantoate 2-reductase [Cyanobacteriota bacterium]